jgi:3-oxoacyl-[acyl-carrier-protein] synthase-3
MKSIDFEIPPERWFTNLAYKGNTGAASIYIILEEFFKSDRIKRGDRILCFIPESGRFSMCYMMLTAV